MLCVSLTESVIAYDRGDASNRAEALRNKTVNKQQNLNAIANNPQIASTSKMQMVSVFV